MRKYFIRIVIIFVLMGASMVNAKTMSYSKIHAMPKSIEKDYYIWRFLKQKKTTLKEAKLISKDIKRISSKLQKAYKKKTKKKLSKKRKIRKPLTKKQKLAIVKKQKYIKSIINSETPFERWLKEKNSNKLSIFNGAGKAGRVKLNQSISAELWKDLTTHRKLNRSIKYIKKENLKKLKAAFAYPPANKNRLSYKNLMYLGYYSLDSYKNSVASKYFSQAAKKAYHREDVDKANFWNYIATKKTSLLHKLTKSYDINIYTLLAYDLLKLKYPKTITPVLPKAKLLSIKKISDPMHWVRLKKEISANKKNLSNLAKKYRSEDTLGFYTYIKAKESREVKQYFPMPYRKLLKKLPKERQALLYAIARQESRFIPSSISSSYALGMMQIMPFLVDHLSKKRKEKIDYDDMFDPKKALIYANEHMNYLTKWLHHPLYIAYAYNAGIGYTRRMLRKKRYFRSNRAHRPYLSIELLDNEQANRYGKHVLANYVIYMNKLGVNIRLIDLINKLHIPNETDKFRK